MILFILFFITFIYFLGVRYLSKKWFFKTTHNCFIIFCNLVKGWYFSHQECKCDYKKVHVSVVDYCFSKMDPIFAQINHEINKIYFSFLDIHRNC